MTTILHYYYFDTSKPDQLKLYEELKTKLKGMGLRLFDSISVGYSEWYSKTIKPLDGKEIELETEYLFENQWNTGPTQTSEQGLRIFDWAEGIYINNRKIKQGQWLEQTDEMKDARAHTFKCGYCGKNHYKPSSQWCNACLGSKYLKQDDLRLLYLHPISKHNKQYNTMVPESLIKEWQAEQQIRKDREEIEDRDRKQKGLPTDDLSKMLNELYRSIGEPNDKK